MTRCIQELGRIVIPKKIRSQLEIKEGDSFEIYVDEKDCSVTFKKI